MIKSTEEKLNVAGAELVMVKAGSGKPLLILHDELGYPGWMTWNETLAHERTLLIPLQPAYGKTPKIDWIRNYRDLGGFYSQVLREMKLDPIDVIGFSAGGFIAAEMACRRSAHLLEGGAGRADGHQTRARRDLRHLSDHYPHPSARDRRGSLQDARVRQALRRRDDGRAVRGIRGRTRRNGSHRMGTVYEQSQPPASAARH